jgi:hypothetical protein
VIDRTDGSTALAFQVDIGAAADENALAAQINSGLGALGSAAIGADGNLEITLANSAQGLAIAEGDSEISFADAGGRDRDYGFSHYFGLNDLLVQNGGRPSDFAVRADIQSDPSRLSTARLDVTASPLSATLGGAGDNRGVQALADALSSARPVIARGGLPAKSVTLATYAGDIIARAPASPTTPSRLRAGIKRSPIRSSTEPPRFPGSISTRRWPVSCSCSRPTGHPPGSSR